MFSLSAPHGTVAACTSAMARLRRIQALLSCGVVTGLLLGCVTATIDPASPDTCERLARTGGANRGLVLEIACSVRSHGACWTSRRRAAAGGVTEESAEALVASEQRRTHEGLTDAESAACSGLAPVDRDSSPFAHTEDILRVERVGGSDAAHGVRVLFRNIPGMTPEWLAEILRCHQARAVAMMSSAPELPYGPFLVHGGDTAVAATADGLVVTMTTADVALADALWRRAQALAPVGR